MINEILKTFSPRSAPGQSPKELNAVERWLEFLRSPNMAALVPISVAESPTRWWIYVVVSSIVIPENKIDWNEDESDIGLTWIKLTIAVIGGVTTDFA